MRLTKKILHYVQNDSKSKFRFLDLNTDDYYPSYLDTRRQAGADGAVQCRGPDLPFGPASVSIHGGGCRLVAWDGG